MWIALWGGVCVCDFVCVCVRAYIPYGTGPRESARVSAPPQFKRFQEDDVIGGHSSTQLRSVPPLAREIIMLAHLFYILSVSAPGWPPVLPEAVCSKHAYCCPDAKRCLLPTKESCAKGESCADGQVCCPLTKICVIPGAACTSPCSNNATYCDADLRHCLQPTNPGTFCSNSRDCSSGESCSEVRKRSCRVGMHV